MNENELLNSLPVLATRDLAIFPGVTVNFDVGRIPSVAAVQAALNGNRLIFVVAQKDGSIIEPSFSDLYEIGVVAEIKQIKNLPEHGTYRIFVEGKYRASIVKEVSASPFFEAVVTARTDKYTKKATKLYTEALLRTVKDLFDDYAALYQKIPGDFAYSVYSAKSLARLTDSISGTAPFDFANKQRLLSELDPIKRGEILCDVLAGEIDVLSLESEIQDKVQNRIDKSQREYFLREQLHVISEELNEDDSPAAEAERYKERIKTLPIDDSSCKKLFDECDRLAKTASSTPEATVSRTYLDRVLDLPWGVFSKESFDIDKARRILEKDHYGLTEVKERIVELIAVRKLSQNVNSQILCLVGPPGVGKTSIAKSLAKALNRKYVRISLGGVHDEAEIRGHRKTYIGSMPGRIIAAIEQAKTQNPLILLDEIDKLGSDYKGDPSSALLEVLDGEQNSTFCDHYIDVPFDLSKVLFITTANDASAIPAALFDRMEIIELYSYTVEEKFCIAKKHLIPKQMKIFNIDNKMFRISDSALRAIISGYTREAGVRTLERMITKLLRKAAVAFADGLPGKFTVTPDKLEAYLGAVKYKGDELDLDNMVGAANGLAWTSVGGEMMQIEAVALDGSGKLELTGSLGEVMKESARAALSYIRSRSAQLGIAPDFYKTKDIHIHAPEGAVPKDGPSAGVTMTTALVSALTGRRVRSDVAMTGEITLRGRVLPIGGLREKSMAAYKNGIKTVLIPKANVSDLEKIDTVVKNAVEFISVSSLDEVLDLALENDGNVVFTEKTPLYTVGD